MSFLVKYWYLIILAFVLSIVSAVVMLYLTRDDWMVEAETPKLQGIDQLPGMSPEYSGWNYDISSVEDLRTKLEAERKEIDVERNQLEVLEKRVQAEIAELETARMALQTLKDEINKDFIEIEESEMRNIQQLAKVYSEMRVDAAVAILSRLDIELIVKIMSQMGEESASKILGEMASSGSNSELTRMATRITELIQQVK